MSSLLISAEEEFYQPEVNENSPLGGTTSQAAHWLQDASKWCQRNRPSAGNQHVVEMVLFVCFLPRVKLSERNINI